MIDGSFWKFLQEIEEANVKKLKINSSYSKFFDLQGNMQRSKIVSDSINEARIQILKVFDHKSHVSDIIHRCASKRNLKKREKS